MPEVCFLFLSGIVIEIEGALRIGIGKFTTEAEIDQAVNIFLKAVFKIRSLISS